MSASGNDNRSVRFTRQRIKTAFFDIMETKSIHKISVAEIVRKADISRATFYLHYLDIYDLTKQIETVIIEQVLEEIARFDESTYVIGEYPIAKRVFEVFDSHSKEIQLLLGPNGDTAFRDRFQAAISEYFKNLLALLITDSDNLENVLIFLTSGILNMFLYNLKSDDPADINTLAMIANRYLRATNKLIGLPEIEAD